MCHGDVDLSFTSLIAPRIFSSDFAESNLNLFSPRDHQNSALLLPPVTKGKTKFGRWWISLINFGQRLLIVFSKSFAVWNEASMKLERPRFVKSVQRNPGVVLNDDAAVLE